jgi:ribokinase
VRNSYTIPTDSAKTPQSAFDVVVVGSLNMDLTARAAHLPAPGETVLGDGFAMIPGGKGSNQAVAAARLGARTAMVGSVGTDAMGTDLLAVLDAEGVDRRGVDRVDDQPTGVALITVDDAGENAIVVARGANDTVTPERVRAHAALVGSAAVLVTQLEIPLASVRVALGLARDRGVRTILDPAPACELDDGIIALVDLVTPNESEVATLTGVTVGDGADTEAVVRAARKLLDRGCGAVLVTLGRRGARYVDAEQQIDVEPYAVEAVDTTAAGDAACGALAAAFARGAPLREALDDAAAAGALAATVTGASRSLPSMAALRALRSAGRAARS